MNRIGHAERAEAVAAGSFESDAITVAAYADIGNAEACTVDGNEFVDLAFQAVGEQVLGAAEVAQTFFTRVSDEGYGAGVFTLASFSALMTPSTTTRPRQSSPMPGPLSRVPSRVTFTSVPSGKTVSR